MEKAAEMTVAPLAAHRPGTAGCRQEWKAPVLQDSSLSLSEVLGHAAPKTKEGDQTDWRATE